jgi:hypothetical protein
MRHLGTDQPPKTQTFPNFPIFAGCLPEFAL